MKRKIFYTFIVLMLIIGISGCAKNDNKNSSDVITIACKDEKDKSTGIEIQNETTYHFNKEQYATDYSVTTTQKFDDKAVYNEYKTAQEGTVKSSSDNVIYDLKADDKKMTLIFTMTIKNINVNDAETEEEKERYKASNVLKSVEDGGYTCEVKGIDKDKLK